MDCPHCKETIDWETVIEEIKKALYTHSAKAASAGAGGKDNEGRARLIAWLEQWRQDCGLPVTNLKGRSTEQLGRMFAHAQLGKSYRTGRKWKTTAH